MQGFAADPVYVKGEVFAYVGRNQNLKGLKAAADHPVSQPTCLQHTQDQTVSPLFYGPYKGG